MESRVNAFEKWTSEQRKNISDLRSDMTLVKESIPDMREIQELLLKSRKERNCQMEEKIQ